MKSPNISGELSTLSYFHAALAQSARAMYCMAYVIGSSPIGSFITNRNF